MGRYKCVTNQSKNQKNSKKQESEKILDTPRTQTAKMMCPTFFIKFTKVSLAYCSFSKEQQVALLTTATAVSVFANMLFQQRNQLIVFIDFPCHEFIACNN